MLERTVLEISQHRFWAWQRRRAVTPRGHLRETDMLLGLVEECRLQRLPQIPIQLWRRIVQLLGQVDSECTERLGIDRSLDRTTNVLFEVQEVLMGAELDRRRPHPEKIIPLFH